MSDAVLAAIIAATATLCATFLQLRVALAKEADARSRGQPISRRRSRLPMILVGIMLLASAVGGFALAQWLNSSQRGAQADLQRELRDRVAELGAAVAVLQRLAADNAAAAPAAASSAAPTAAPAAAPAHPLPAAPTEIGTSPLAPLALPASAAEPGVTPVLAQTPPP